MKEKLSDDYKWEEYTNQYSKQILEEIKPVRELLLKDFSVADNDIKFYDNLCANWKELYYQVVRTGVSSVLECGCGSGQHLQNLYTINNKLDLCGCELLQSQIDFGRTKLGISESVLKNITVLDMSVVGAHKHFKKKFDFVYTQAVLMHLSTKKVVTFVENMVQLSNRYILVLENPRDHEYESIIHDVCKRMGVQCSVQKTSKHSNHGTLVSLTKEN